MNINRLKQVFTTMVLLILGSSVLVWPLFTGVALQRDFGATLESLSEPNHWSVHETEFNRGWFNSEARSLLTLEGDLAKQFQENRISFDSRIPLQATLIHHIHHGPVLGMGRPSLFPAAALIETTLEFPPETQEWLQPLFNNKSPLQMRTLLQLNGELTTRIESPAVHGELTGGTKMHWQGIAGTLVVGAARDTIQGDLTMPLLDLANDAGQLKLNQLDLRVDTRRHRAGLWLGDVSLDLKTFSFLVPGKPAQGFALSGLNSSSSSRDAAQTLHALISLDLDNLAVGERPFGSGGITVEVQNIDLLSFTNLYKGLKYLEQQATDNQAQTEEQVKQIIATQLPTLIRHSPEIGISRLDLKTPQGAIQGKLRLALRGGNDAWSINPAEIFQRLNVEIELAVPSILVTDLIQAQTIKEMIAQGELNEKSPEKEKFAQTIAEQRIAALVEQGLLILYKDCYSTRIKFSKGQLDINGRLHNELFAILRGGN